MNDTDFRPTHVTPLDGLPTWARPDPSEPSAWLDALLPVRVTATEGDWSHVLCSNGWGAWVDGRLLVALPDQPPGTSRPLARTPDPRPLLARLERALETYRRLVEQLADGSLDLATFRQRSAGIRVGIIVDGESAWLLDLEHDRWWYCHDSQLQTFATVEAPPGLHGGNESAADENPASGSSASENPASEGSADEGSADEGSADESAADESPSGERPAGEGAANEHPSGQHTEAAPPPVSRTASPAQAGER